MSRRRKFLIVAGIVLGVAILIPVIRHYQLRLAVVNYVAELKAKGEPMELVQVIPPPAPPEQNGVPFITNALADFYSEIFATNLTIIYRQQCTKFCPAKQWLVGNSQKLLGLMNLLNY
jgi:hypothetical protein